MFTPVAGHRASCACGGAEQLAEHTSPTGPRLSILVVCGAATKDPSCVWSNRAGYVGYPSLEAAPWLLLLLSETPIRLENTLKLKHGYRRGSPGVLLVFASEEEPLRQDAKLRNVTVVFSLPPGATLHPLSPCRVTSLCPAHLALVGGPRQPAELPSRGEPSLPAPINISGSI